MDFGTFTLARSRIKYTIELVGVWKEGIIAVLRLFKGF